MIWLLVCAFAADPELPEPDHEPTPAERIEQRLDHVEEADARLARIEEALEAYADAVEAETEDTGINDVDEADVDEPAAEPDLPEEPASEEAETAEP